MAEVRFARPRIAAMPRYRARFDGVSAEQQAPDETAGTTATRQENDRQRKALQAHFGTDSPNLPELQHRRVNRHAGRLAEPLETPVPPLGTDSQRSRERPDESQAMKKSPVFTMPCGVPQVELGPSRATGLSEVSGFERAKSTETA